MSHDILENLREVVQSEQCVQDFVKPGLLVGELVSLVLVHRSANFLVYRLR